MKNELMSISKRLCTMAASMTNDNPNQLKPVPYPIDEVLPADEVPATIPPGTVVTAPPGMVVTDRWEPKPLVMAWIECNRGRQLPATLKGLKRWGRDCIVSTRPGKAWILRKIKEALPNIRIIPGLKTYQLLGDFDGRGGWHDVADQVVEFLSVTGGKEFLFEHESAVRGIWGDKKYAAQTYDKNNLINAIRFSALPKDVAYYWYPGVPGRRQPVQSIYRDLLSAAAKAIPHLVLVDHSSVNGPDATNHVNQRAGAMSRNTEIPTVGMQYFYGPGSPWWQDSQLEVALKTAGQFYDKVILYTGSERWAKASGQLSKRLMRIGYGGLRKTSRMEASR